MSAAGYVLVAVGWLIWFVPFPLTGWSSKTPNRKDPRARWGLALECFAYAILCLGEFWARSPSVFRLVCAAVFLILAAILSWTATRALGPHLRFDAALTPDHQLVRSGAYRFVRHPIYTSMLCLLLGTGLVIASVPLLILSVVIFICGTEIRVRVEDGLLSSRFGAEFREYQRGVSAYVPFVR